MATTNDDLNEDWIKTQSWDLGSFDDLLGYLGVRSADTARQRLALASFMLLPAWQAAPDEIKQAVNRLRRN